MAGDNLLGQFGSFLFPGGNPFYQGDDELKKKYDLYASGLKDSDGNWTVRPDPEKAALLKVEMDADETHQQQQYMKMAAEAGASSGGAGIASGGQKMPYGDTSMFNPKAMPSRYLPGTKPRDEDELIPPGFAQFPYRMYR